MNAHRATTLLLLVLALHPVALAAQRIDTRALAEAEKLRKSRATAEEVVRVLQRSHRQSGEQSIAIVQRVGFAAAPASQAVRSVYRAGAVDLAEWMRRAGYDDSTTLSALSAQRASTSEVVRGLRAGGARSVEVGSALQSARVSSGDAVRALKDGGYAADDAIEGLARAGYRVTDMKAPVRQAYVDRAVWLKPITRALVADGVLDPADPAQMAEEAANLQLTAAEAVAWMEDEGVDELEAIAALAKAGYAAEEVGEVAAQRLDSEAEATALATLMRGLGVAIPIVAAVVSTVVATITFGAVLPIVMVALLASGFTVGAVIGVANSQGGSPEEIVGGLWEGGVSGAEIALGMKDQGAGTLIQVAQGLYRATADLGSTTSAVYAAGYPVADIAGALPDLGASAADLRAAFGQLISDAGLSLSDAATLLVDAGADPATVGAVLDAAFTYNDETIALYLKTSGMDAEEIAIALRDGVGTGLDEVARILRSQGFSFETIALAFEGGLSLQAQAIAQALFEAGMRSDQLLILLTTVMQLQHEAAMNVISNLSG